MEGWSECAILNWKPAYDLALKKLRAMVFIWLILKRALRW